MKKITDKYIAVLLVPVIVILLAAVPLPADELEEAQARKEQLEAELAATQAEAEELLAVASCHEIDHLDGILFKEHLIGDLVADVDDADEAEELLNR